MGGFTAETCREECPEKAPIFFYEGLRVFTALRSSQSLTVFLLFACSDTAPPPQLQCLRQCLRTSLAASVQTLEFGGLGSGGFRTDSTYNAKTCTIAPGQQKPAEKS